jgi:hypothetical protein
MLLREHERAVFTDRSEILRMLHYNAELTRQGKDVNFALVGQQRIGKTMLARRFADDLSESHSPLVPIYFDVARNLFVPSVFAIRLLATISRSFVEADGRQVEKSGGEVHSYLKRLGEIDLVDREGRRYTIADPIIALWLKFTILERTPGYGPHKDAIRRYQDRLMEKTV